MASARAAKAAALACLVALAAWLASPGPQRSGHVTVGAGAAPTAADGAWQYDAIGLGRVPDSALESAAGIKVGVVDTGADLSSPDLAGRNVTVVALGRKRAPTLDVNGHGTFVTSLLARTSGEAPLLVVQGAAADGSVRDTSEAAAIRYAVDHGARVLNLSIAGVTTSAVERGAISYAIRRGVLVVAAAGNEYAKGNPVEYPAALLQPVGSNGRGGAGLAVTATTAAGTRAPFSNSGSWISLAAPGVAIFGALSQLSSPTAYPRATVGFGYASGTSYAAPQVAGAAALVWGVNPSLTARRVAQILEETASGHGTWTPDLGFGVVDVAAAVARAESTL